MIKEFEYISATTAQEAANHLGCTYFAGGTDLVPLLKYEVREFGTIVDLTKVTELKYTTIQADCVSIGAMETLTSIQRNQQLQEILPALCFAAKCVASPQIRNIGTIGGNIMQDRRCLFFNQSYEWRQSIEPCFKTGGCKCHQAPASPVCRAPYYSDVATALYAYGATAMIIDQNGQREISITELLEHHGKINGTTQTDGLFVKEFVIPTGFGWSKFIKESVRDTIDFPTFNACASVKNGAVSIAVGAIHMHPVLLTKTAQAVADKASSATVVETAMAEIKANMVLVREDSITPKIKRDSCKGILPLLDSLLSHL